VSRRVSKVHFDAAAPLDKSIGYMLSAMPPWHWRHIGMTVSRSAMLMKSIARSPLVEGVPLGQSTLIHLNLADGFVTIALRQRD
jgi:hypothetical protein